MKRIVVSLIIFIFIITGAVTLKYYNPFKKEKTPTDLAVSQLAEQLLARENETGQFKTWEDLYGTSTSAATTSKSTEEKNYTSTDLFSQQIFKEYLIRKQAGEEITPEVSAEIAANVLSKSYATEDNTPTNSITDLHVIPSEYLTMVSYGNKLVRALSVPLPQGQTKSEIELLEDILNNPSLLGEIDFKPFITRYTTMKSNLLAMSVPQPVVNAHLNLVNGVNNFIVAVKGMDDLYNDPIGGMGKTAAYETAVALLDMGFTEARSVLKVEGIQFSPDEPGYALFF